MTQTPLELARQHFVPTVFTRDELRAAGYSSRQITDAVHDGRMLRLRRDRYALPGLRREVAHAARIGGRLTCLSLLQLLGVFVLKVDAVHVHLERNRSRFRGREAGARIHWSAPSACRLSHVTLLSEAIRHSVKCQDPRASLATLDSVLQHGLLTLGELEVIFRSLAPRYRVLLTLVDPAAGSGPETFMRVILRTLGLRFEAQVDIDGVGRVDFVVEGWLIIECDSKTFHEGWDKQVEDRNRDIAAARIGYVTVRPLATDLLYRPQEVQAALKDVVETLRPDGHRSQLRKSVRRGA